MSGAIRGPLAIRVDDGHTTRHVTRYCSGLKFTKTAPGGHDSLSFTMTVPRDTFADLGPADGAWVYDARTGATIFGKAYLENPTPVDGPRGQQYAISAVGGMALPSDETRALIYVDQTLDAFESAADTSTSASVETGSQTNGVDDPGVQEQFPSGSLAASGAVASAGHYLLQRAGMTLGAIHAVLHGGKSDSSWVQELVTPAGAVASGNLAVGPSAFDLYVGAGGGADLIPAGTDRFAFQLRRNAGATNVADELTWFRQTALYVLCRRMDRHGALLNGAAGMGTALSVLASQVVEDLLGRVLTFCDPATAQVETTTYAINQLAYPDGAKASGVFGDLTTYESDYLWEILETLPNGLHRFNFRAWPTTPRYEISTADGYAQQGSDVDLCNRILVTWTDSVGNTQVTPVTAAGLGLLGRGLPVDALGDRVKDADPITLPDGHGSAENALQIGAAILRDKINPPTAASAVVSRAILDRLTGNQVMPWELEPGYLCRVRELGIDLPVTQIDYDDDSTSTTLTLGRPVLSDDQRLVRLETSSPGIHIAA
jgi:hypothetical protein